MSREKLAALLPPEVLADATRQEVLEGGAAKRKDRGDGEGTKWVWVDKTQRVEKTQRGGKRTGAGRPKGSLGKPKELADPAVKKTQRRRRAHT